jgi:D-glycero-D-manno-heptose 1,7-bisphosphate phosphatase
LNTDARKVGADRRSAVFIDRDGTIIINRRYISDPDQVELLPGAAEGIRLFSEAGYLIIVVTNQSGVARGWMTMDDVRAVNKRAHGLLRENGADWDDVYVCPHKAEDMLSPGEEVCPCRKPRSGNVALAVAKWNVDVAGSVVIGDRASDVALGQAVGCRAVMIRGEDFDEELALLEKPPDFVAVDLIEAAEWILKKQT